MVELSNPNRAGDPLAGVKTDVPRGPSQQAGATGLGNVSGGPKVNPATQHRDYQKFVAQWRRIRDCYEGSDKVKSAGTAYLPTLDSHVMDTAGTLKLWGGSSKYNAYKMRALFFNALGRTVDGLAGLIFQRAPFIKVPEAVVDHLADVTMTNDPAELMGLYVTRELLVTGRYGILVDMPVEADPKDARPYWTGYLAEDIVNWRVELLGGYPVVTLVVLREDEELPDQDGDPFVWVVKSRYRVLSLSPLDPKSAAKDQPRNYHVQVWRQDEQQRWGAEPALVPQRLGEPLPFIPFTFVGPTAVSDKVEKPPLVDLADLNLSHYRTMADLEHGRHFVALPTPWLAGVPAAEKSDTSIALGAETVLILNQGGQCGMLEFSGAGLRALEKADDDKRSMMAALGARLLESPGKSSRETATSVEMRHAGEHATLRTIAQSCEQALTQVLRTHAWWAGEGGDLPNDFDSDEVKFELNKDFFSAKMDAPTLTAWVQALQAEAISYDTFWAAMTDGGLARPVSAEEELAQIHKQAAAAPGAQMPNAPAPLGAPGQKPGAPGPKVQDAGPGVKPGDVVAKDEGPYKLLNRAGRWLVVKADTGQPVKGGDHGADKKKALAHLAALAIATKGEGKGV